MPGETEDDCRCPYVAVGMYPTSSRNWDEDCPVHGVGTTYFRSMKILPFGYADERATTREEWLAWKRGVSHD